MKTYRKKNGDVKPEKLTVADCAYLAGIIDGEGCVSIGCRKGVGTFTIHLVIASTDIQFLYDLQALWGGIGSMCLRNKTTEKNWSPALQWTITGYDVIEVLKLTRPYMRIKASQADLAFKFEFIGWKRK